MEKNSNWKSRNFRLKNFSIDFCLFFFSLICQPWLLDSDCPNWGILIRSLLPCSLLLFSGEYRRATSIWFGKSKIYSSAWFLWGKTLRMNCFSPCPRPPDVCSFWFFPSVNCHGRVNLFHPLTKNYCVIFFAFILLFFIRRH